MYSCKKCEATFEKVTELGNHNRWYHKDKSLKYTCSKCIKIFEDASCLANHIKHCKGLIEKVSRICPKCNIHIKTCFKKHVNYCTGNGPRRLMKRHPGGNKWLQDKTYEEIYGKEKALEIKKKMSDCLKNNKNWSKVSNVVKEYNSNRARAVILKRYAEGWLPKSGRCKKIIYESPIAGTVRLDGSWELLVALYLDAENIKWRRNRERFQYINLKGKVSHYTPDFFIEDWDKFLEVKGYEEDLDRCKWSQFKKPLIVWKKSEIKKIKEYVQLDTKCLEKYHRYYKKIKIS